MASQITSLRIVYSTVYSGPDQRKHQISASLAFMRGIHRWLVNSPHKGPVTRSRLSSDWGPYLLGGPDLLGGTPRPRTRYGVPNPTNLHWHTYGVILNTVHNSDWLRLGNVLNNMYHIRKVVSRHKNDHCSRDTQPMSGNTMLRDTLSRFCF